MKTKSTLRLILAIGVTTLIVACATRSANRLAALPDLDIPMPCITRPIVLKHCDLKTDPPTCATAIVHFKKGCEQISIPQENKK